MGDLDFIFFDGISVDTLRYKSVEETASITRSDRIRDLGAWVQLPYGNFGSPSHPLLEVISCQDGRSLYAYLSGGILLHRLKMSRMLREVAEKVILARPEVLHDLRASGNLRRSLAT